MTTAFTRGGMAAVAAGAAASGRRAAASLPRLDYGSSPFNDAVLPRVDPLHRPYEPTPWLWNAHLQLLWLLLREAIEPSLRYERTDILRMRDGGTTALDWLGLDEAPDTPTLVVLPSITGDAQSTRTLVQDLRRATGWRVVVCARRGHGDLELTAPVLNTMGCTEDLREQLLRIALELPHSPLYAIGVSAGSALLVRYLGEEGEHARLRAGVAYCPGYDMRVAWGRVPKFYSRMMARRLKRYFLQRHARALARLETYQACLAAPDLETFHANAYELAGWPTHEQYLENTNPVPVFDRVRRPVMVLNAADDPVCVAQNAEEHVDAVRRVPDAVLVRTARGSHCAFFEGWNARSWAHRLMAGYLLAAHEFGMSRAAHPAS